MTPVAQVVDTDLNQPVSREYQKLEVMVHIQQMRDGASIPSCKPEQCIDNMTGVLRHKELHVQAADGFRKAGWLCSLDDAAGDEHIVREAGCFWKELNMRANVTAAVAAVRTEVAAGRLHWNQSDVQRLIKPYTRRSKADDILERIGYDAGNDRADESDDDASAANLNDGDDKHSDSDHSAMESDATDGGSGEDKQSVAACDDEHPSAVAEDPTVTNDDTALPEEAEYILQSRNSIAALQQAKQALEQVGQIAAVVNLENEIRKEERTL